MNEIVVLAGADTDMLRKYVELDEQDEARRMRSKETYRTLSA